MLSTFPSGYLYSNNEGLRQIIEGIAQTYCQISKDVQKVFDDLFFINKDNQFLQEFLAEYGLPNIIFPNINNAEQAAFAISMTKQSRLLVSKEDFENFLLLLGYNVKFYHYQNTLIDHYIYPYTYPKIYGGIVPKNKITWLIDIVEGSQSQANYGLPHPIYYFNPLQDTNFVKKVLDYFKPDYIIFKYLNQKTKDFYGIS